MIVAFFFQVFCGGQQRHVNVGVRCRALGQPDLLLPGWTQGHHRRLFLRKGQLRCRFTSANLHIYICVCRCGSVCSSLVCMFTQLYTVSQDGTLCVWESDTELDGLILKKSQDKPKLPRQGEEEEEEESEERDKVEGEEGEVIRGKVETAKEREKKKNVRYKMMSK